MESTYFPVALESLGATIRYWDLLKGTFQVDDIRVSTHHLNHPALTLAYRIEADGATIVYACDHEVYSHAAADGNVRLEGPDLRHAEFIAGADLLIHDAQYTAAEYPTKVNWGHSTIEYAMLVAREANVRQLALTHHDPSRTDEQIDALVVSARDTMRECRSPIEVFAASEGLTIEVQPAASPTIAIDRAKDRRRMPVLVVSDREYSGGETPGVDEWLVTPFSSTYAQAKVQAWVHRGASRWRKAAIPKDEEIRLETLRSINLLDTPPDARFDRITRLAGRFFAVPIALITLVDSERQWFKSCIGLEIRETSRESSFCAHAVFNRKTLVVNDALADDRFAENPLVVDEPRVRFYVGSPLILKDGTCLGALAVLDTRPRWFAASDVQLLEDLRDLAVSEIERERAARGGRRTGQNRRA